MNRFEEMIQQGKDIIARTKTLLEQEIDLNTAGTVDISVYLTSLKDIHKESLEFTNPDIAESLEEYKDGMSNEDYMEFLTQYLAVRAEIMGELRDRVYDRTSRIDMALNSKIEANNALHKEMAMLNEEIEAIRGDIAQIESTIEILRNSNNEAAIKPLEDAKKNMLERIAAKEKRIEDIKKEKEILLHGGVMPVNDLEYEEEPEEEERPPLPEEDEEEELTPLPEEDEDEEEHEDEEDHDREHGEGAGFVPVFPELDEDEDELEEDEEEELAPLPEEDDDSDEAEEEEEEEEEITPVPTDDDEEVEVIHHTDAKPTLLRRIGNIVYAVITFLGSCAALVVTVDHFQNHHDIEPAQEEESQLDEDDLEENPAQDDEEQDDDKTQTPDDHTPTDDTPSDQTPSQDDDKEDEKDEDKDEDKEEDKDEDKEEEKDDGDELAALPAELAPGEFIFDRDTGLEVGATGDAYVHVGDVTLEDEKKDLEATDHGTVIVDAEDMTTDQKLPELTGDELTYDEATKDMTDQEISDLDAALAEWAAQFDSGLTLK